MRFTPRPWSLLAMRTPFLAFAYFWYTLFGMILGAILFNAVEHGFADLLDVIRRMRPAGWLVLAALFSPGPLAHWLHFRFKPKPPISEISDSD